MSRTRPMKRSNPYVTVSVPATKRVAVRQTPSSMRMRAPTRAYTRSLVPLRTFGYRPNNVEKKVNDLDTNTYQVNTTGTFTLLCNPSVGADMTNRVGRRITIKSAYIKGRLQVEGAATPNNVQVGAQHCRFILFMDYQPNGAAPLVTDLLVSATPASHLNLNNRDRFKILSDKEWVLDPFILSNTATQSYASTSGVSKFVKKFKALNEDVVFSTSTASIADITSGALYMFWIGSQAAGANTDANFIGATRVRYSDV